MRLPRVARGALFLIALPLSAQEPAPRPTLKEVSEELTCQCGGCNHMLSNCTMQGCGSAVPMRKDIEERIAKGESKEAIVAAFVDIFGSRVLSAPPARGFNLSAWLTPFLVLAAGGFVAWRVLLGWRRGALSGSKDDGVPVPFPPAALTDDRRSAIERELRDFEA
jgi:cytochrome c-type biogenesis protein CcmH/NrfF